MEGAAGLDFQTWATHLIFLAREPRSLSHPALGPGSRPIGRPHGQSGKPGTFGAFQGEKRRQPLQIVIFCDHNHGAQLFPIMSAAGSPSKCKLITLAWKRPPSVPQVICPRSLAQLLRSAALRTTAPREIRWLRRRVPSGRPRCQLAPTRPPCRQRTSTRP